MTKKEALEILLKHMKDGRIAAISPDAILNNKVDPSIDQACAILNFAVASNGTLYKKECDGFLPELMNLMYEKRKQTKQKMSSLKKDMAKEGLTLEEKNKIQKQIDRYNTQQMAYKIALNSAYGALGNQYFRHYDVRQAEAITLSGQLSIRWIQNKLNAYLNKLFKTNNRDYVIASDTDSVYLNLKTAVDVSCPNETDKNKIVDFLDKFCKQILDPYIEKCYNELAVRMNAYAQKMDMKREVIADRGLWKAKKMYCLNVYDSEGIRYSEPQLKIMGIEVQRSSTPSICREHLKQCVKIILTQDEQHLIDYIDKFKSIFFASAPEDISFPRGVNGMDKYSSDTTIFRKGTPIHVKGALIYNHLLDKLKINKLYTKIGDGDKIKFLYLREPNPTTDRVISYTGKIPPEMKLDKFVDYNAQFEKAFLDPLIGLLEVIGWHHERKNSLEGFFA
jgi:DNA polymerase elongation subunit (family B)